MKKVIVLIGASDPLSVASGRWLAAHGHEVVGVGLSAKEAVVMSREFDMVFLADFQSLRDVRSLADDLLETYSRIDVLANDAGALFKLERALTDDGHERTFQVNYLAPFLLTNLLIDRLIESRATVVFASRFETPSTGHVDLDDLDSERTYDSCNVYRTTALERILFTHELHRRFNGAGLASAASSADNLGVLAEGTPEIDFASGEYFANGHLAGQNVATDDRIFARELWTRSEAMVAEFLAGSPARFPSVLTHVDMRAVHA